MPTELELKQFLAEMLPEKIKIYLSDLQSGIVFRWTVEPRPLSQESDLGPMILETEWPCIVSLVEQQVPSESDYFNALEKQWGLDQRAIPFNYWLVHLIWQTRTLALKEVLVKKG